MNRKKTILQIVLIFGLLFGLLGLLGMVNLGGPSTYDMEAVDGYVVVMDTRTSQIRVLNIGQADNTQPFPNNLHRYADTKR